jgi:hypothetical protein
MINEMMENNPPKKARGRREWGPAIAAMIAGAGGLSLLALILMLGNQVAGLQADHRADQSQIASLQHQVKSAPGQSQEIAHQGQEIAQLKAQLTASSPTGVFITCTDLEIFQQQLNLQGSDSAGVTVFSSIVGQPWFPRHCLKTGGG